MYFTKILVPRRCLPKDPSKIKKLKLSPGPRPYGGAFFAKMPAAEKKKNSFVLDIPSAIPVWHPWGFRSKTRLANPELDQFWGFLGFSVLSLASATATLGRNTQSYLALPAPNLHAWSMLAVLSWKVHTHEKEA